MDKHSMLDIKFYTHSASYFFNDQMGIFDKEVGEIITGEQKLSETIKEIGHSFETFEKEAPSTIVAGMHDRLSAKLFEGFSNRYSYKDIERLIYMLLDEMMQRIEVVVSGRNEIINLISRLSATLYIL